MREGEPCIFCEIVAGRAPAHRIDEDERSLAILDIQPLAEGHCLVIPKRHVPWWHELREDETASLFALANRVARCLMRAYASDFVCLYARGRRIPHTHLFLVPTRKGDALDALFNALERFQESAPSLASLADEARLRAVAETLRRAGA